MKPQSISSFNEMLYSPSIVIDGAFLLMLWP